MNYKNMEKEKKEIAIIECADYDSMGNHGRFPKQKVRKSTISIIKEKIKIKL